MARMKGLKRFIIPCFIVIAGCQTTPDFHQLMKTKQASIDALTDKSSRNNALSHTGQQYQRRLTINFESDELQATSHHTQIIQLFFRSLPEAHSVRIIVSVAPSSSDEPFQVLKDSRARLKNLEALLTRYSEQIELIYQPEMTINTAGIQVIGNMGSGAGHVQ